MGPQNVDQRSEKEQVCRFNITKYLLSLCEGDPEEFVHRVVTQDETCVNYFDTEANPLLRN